MSRPLIIVLDDDPTGSQTVHSCLLLTQWDVETLCLGLQDTAPLCFILTNTRAVAPDRAREITTQVCQNLRQALDRCGIEDFLVVSRSDSTLRGHYPIETDVIAQELGPFDAHFLVPAFLEGGRFTQGSIHYLMVNGVPTPTHETEFARDSVFGYRTSYLPDYVAEKTGGKIPADQVERFLVQDYSPGLLDRLLHLQGNRCGVVDATSQGELDYFAQAVLSAGSEGKRFLFRSAASLLTSLAQLPPQPIGAEEMSQYVITENPGVVVVGSHVQKTTAQLNVLLQLPGICPIEVEVSLLRHSPPKELRDYALSRVEHAYNQGLTPVIFTSREELTFADQQTRLDFGQQVSGLLMQIVQGLPPAIGFLVSKGGITSNDVLSTGLALKAVRLLGQVLPGVSVVRTDRDHPRFPLLPVVLFPGNVGDDQALATVYQRLSRHGA